MALEAQVRARFRADLAVRIVAGRAGKAVLAQDLVRMGDLFKLGNAAVAAVANLRPMAPRFWMLRVSLACPLGGFLLALLLQIADRLCLRFWRPSRGDGCRRRAGRHVVMRSVAVGAGDALVRMDRCPPARCPAAHWSC